MPVKINDYVLRGLVDTGCTASLLSTSVASRLGLHTHPSSNVVCMLDGYSTSTTRWANGRVTIDGQSLDTEFLVVSQLVDGCDAIIGIDVIAALGGVTVSPGMGVTFGRPGDCGVTSIHQCGSSDD